MARIYKLKTGLFSLIPGVTLITFTFANTTLENMRFLPEGLQLIIGIIASIFGAYTIWKA